MKKIILLLTAIVVIFSLFACGEYNPADEPVDNNTGTDEAPKDEGSDDVNKGEGYTFTATLVFEDNGTIFIPEDQSDPERMLKVRWTDGSNYYTVPVGADGKAVCEGLDGDYSVTLINLSGEYTYNPNIYVANNDNRDVEIRIHSLNYGRGDGTGLYDCIEIDELGVYRAEIKSEGQIVYFQFTPPRPGVYVIESWMDVTAGMYNPLADVYHGSSQFKYPDDTLDDGGASQGYTKNFKKVIKIAESFIGNCYTYGVKVDGKDSVYPVYVDFAITYEGGYTYDGISKDFVLPTFIPNYKYAEWYEEYIDYLSAERAKYGDDYHDASVMIDGKRIFDQNNYKLNTADGYYHVFDLEKYASTGGWGPILYADISRGMKFIDASFHEIEYKGNNALTLNGGTQNYKVFIEGYYNIVSHTGDPNDRASGPYFCTSDCPCLATNGGCCAIEDHCTKCTPDCRHLPSSGIGQRGYADIAIDGRCPVTEELRVFLQAYCVKEKLFSDGNGWAEQYVPRYDAYEDSQWLFACGYYE